MEALRHARPDLARFQSRSGSPQTRRGEIGVTTKLKKEGEPRSQIPMYPSCMVERMT